MRGLEIGVNDYLVRPIDKNELLARVRTQIRRKRYTDAAARQCSAVDGNGDHRRPHGPLQSPLHGKPPGDAGGAGGRDAASRSRCWCSTSTTSSRSTTPTATTAGDDVLREFAVRVKKSIRGIDLACRYGGEEFVVVMPETDMAVAALVAERIRRRIAGEPFAIDQGAKAIEVTLSIGLVGARTLGRHRRQRFSSAPTRRSIAPSAMAAIAWWRTRLSGALRGEACPCREPSGRRPSSPANLNALRYLRISRLGEPQALAFRACWTTLKGAGREDARSWPVPLHNRVNIAR